MAREHSNNIDGAINIGPMVYEIVSSCKLTHDGEELRGKIDHADLSIYIEEEMPSSAQMVTVLHEVIHAILHQAGIEAGEDIISAMSYGIYAFIRANPYTINKIRQGAISVRSDDGYD